MVAYALLMYARGVLLASLAVSSATAINDSMTVLAARAVALVIATFATVDGVRVSPSAGVFAPTLIRAGPLTITGMTAPAAYGRPGPVADCVLIESDGAFAPTTPTTVLSLRVVVVLASVPVTSMTTTSPGSSVPPL